MCILMKRPKPNKNQNIFVPNNKSEVGGFSILSLNFWENWDKSATSQVVSLRNTLIYNKIQQKNF